MSQLRLLCHDCDTDVDSEHLARPFNLSRHVTRIFDSSHEDIHALRKRRSVLKFLHVDNEE